MKYHHKKKAFTRRSTKKTRVIRPRVNIKAIIITSSCILVVTIAALICGTLLEKRAEKYAAEREAGAWTLDDNEVIAIPTEVPRILASPLSPEEYSHRLPYYNGSRSNGATLLLRDSSGNICYSSKVANTAGIISEQKTLPSLERHVSELHKSGVRTICVFHVSSLDLYTDDDDRALQTYQRGLELAMIEEYALSGTDEILLVGCPAYDHKAIERTSSFLDDLADILAKYTDRVTIGIAVSLPLINKAYSGDISIARLLSSCDYLALDLSDPAEYSMYGGSDFNYAFSPADSQTGGSELGKLLSRFTYAYQRYSLRLMFDEGQKDEIAEALSHGFDNIIAVK